MKKYLKFAAIGCLLSTALPVWAEMPKADRKAAKRMLDGTLYLRMDAPCATGRHPYGTYKRPLVEVSPEGSNTDTDTMMSASFWHADSTYWGIRVNDSVELDEADFDDDEVELELEGVGNSEDNDTVIKFIGIHSLDDFKKAFEQTFSRVPLQEEHPDWPADVREAIGERRFLDGMTKRQAFYVAGTPEKFEKFDENGKEVEIWTVRTDKGVKMGFFTAKAKKEEGMPSTLRFVDGKLTGTTTSGSGDSEGFSID